MIFILKLLTLIIKLEIDGNMPKMLTNLKIYINILAHQIQTIHEYSLQMRMTHIIFARLYLSYAGYKNDYPMTPTRTLC